MDIWASDTARKSSSNLYNRESRRKERQVKSLMELFRSNESKSECLAEMAGNNSIDKRPPLRLEKEDLSYLFVHTSCRYIEYETSLDVWNRLRKEQFKTL